MRYSIRLASAALALSMIFGGLKTPVNAQDEPTKSAIQKIIRDQMLAFERDDGATAYSYASPSIQALMGNAETFLEMVRQGYAPVYRHRSFEFGEAQGSGSIYAQKARIIDANGKPWDALYMLKQMPDGSWRITGCILSEVGVDA